MEVISLYEMEVPPLEILSLMKKNINKNDYEEKNTIYIDKSYILQRKSLITLIHKIHREMGFKSQTFFLAVNYLDIIFSNNNKCSYNYNLLAVGCLIVASKYCENVPLRPTFNNFVNIYNKKVKDKNYATKEILFEYEIIICKKLNYKLNYFTIYDFNFFFFGNGVIKIDQLKEINPDIASMSIENNSNSSSSSQIKKILIKIYERSRHYLDIIIENLICLKYNSLLISICIMEKSIDYVLLNEMNLIDCENYGNIEEIKARNEKYYKEIMKDFYKIDYDSLSKYHELKKECEIYKLFDEIYDKINLYNSNNKIPINKEVILKSKSPSKEVSIMRKSTYKQSPDTKYNNNTNCFEKKDKINFLYRKVNIPSQNNCIKNNLNSINRQHSSNKKITSSRENNFQNDFNNYENSKILTTIDNFYQNNRNFRNSTSNYKNNNNYYLKKCNTSSSPFKKSPTNNLTNISKKSKVFSKIKNRSIIECSLEGLTTNSNSIDTKKNKKRNNNIINTNKNIKKPYIKKIVQNYDRPQEEKNRWRDNKNININININNKILYEGPNNYKDKSKASKKIMISRYLNKSNCSLIRGKSFAYKSKSKNNKKDNEKNSSPIIERNNSNYKYNYVPFKFNKNNNLQMKKNSNNSILQNQSNSIYIKDNDKNSINNENANINKNNNIYRISSKYNLYNSNLTSRNSFQYPKHNSKLTDSLINIKMTRLNYEPNQNPNQNSNNISILDYNNIDKNNKINEYINNSSELNLFKYRNNLTKNINLFDTNYIEGYKNKKKKLNKIQNEIIKINLQVKEFNDNDETNVEENNDKKISNLSNTNLLDYSIVVSNNKKKE